MYPEIDQVEREQVEYVFGLTGGELSDRPLRYYGSTETGCGNVLDPKRKWARYWYDGAPDYVGRQFDRFGSVMTMVMDCLFGYPPKRILSQGKVWRRVAAFTNSGECECPEADGMVRYDSTGGECRLCGAADQEEHGFIYLGDGWTEVVYVSRA